MTTKKDIMDMWAFLRKENMSIPDEALDFMKETCLSALDGKSESYVCTDFKLSLNDMKMRTQKVVQPANGSIFTVTISSR